MYSKIFILAVLLGLFEYSHQSKYLGCFADNADDRDLGYSSENELLTVEKCVSYCAQRGYAFAGMQEGYFCNCGNHHGRHGKLEESECDNSCYGDTNEICGGQSKNSVYETGVVPTKKALPANYLGCFNDDKETREMGHRHDDEQLTIEKCVAHCQNQGYPYAGLQGAVHCHCGNFYGRFGRRDNKSCDNNCPGDIGQNCGGNGKYSVFKTVVNPKNITYSTRYLGCFEDRDEDRDMFDYVLLEGATIPKCVEHCKSHGYRFAGLQKGNECYCDDFYGRFGRRDNRECDMNCDGDKNQLCGGFWRNSVYRV